MAVDFTSPWPWLGVAVLVAATGLWLRYEFRHAADDMDPPPTCPDTAGNVIDADPWRRRHTAEHPAVVASLDQRRNRNRDGGAA
jgi:hypothetical protein